MSRSIAARNAASVLPEPVGAWISVCAPVAIAATTAALAAHPSVELARFVFRDEKTLGPYLAALGS